MHKHRQRKEEEVTTRGESREEYAAAVEKHGWSLLVVLFLGMVLAQLRAQEPSAAFGAILTAAVQARDLGLDSSAPRRAPADEPFEASLLKHGLQFKKLSGHDAFCCKQLNSAD
ncbi:hypothetical protein ACP70R_020627 [Stipagrostis hirtigluma subsp. patula]